MGDAESQRRLTERFTLAMMMKGTHRTLLLGGDEEYDRKQTTFTGLPELMDVQHEVIAAALDMPLTRFMGRSPGGLNSTGDNELRNYYDMIRSRQQTDLADTLKPLDDALKAHVGATGDGVDYAWLPLWVPTPTEKAAIEKTQAEVDALYVNMGIFPDDGLGRAVRDRLISEGTYPSLDQHVPEDALAFERPSALGFDPAAEPDAE
jgi:phage-related protein (TIGR01555 family)